MASGRLDNWEPAAPAPVMRLIAVRGSPRSWY